MNLYDYHVTGNSGQRIALSDYAGKVLLLVNTASKCGFTPQYEELEALYQNYRQQGLVILAFPCNQFHDQEPGSDAEIREFCTRTYGVSFPIMAKVEVVGKNALPLYQHLCAYTTFKGFDLDHPLGQKLDEILSAENPDYHQDSSIKWNFTKFLIDRKGEIAARFEPTVPLEKIKEKILTLL